MCVCVSVFLRFIKEIRQGTMLDLYGLHHRGMKSYCVKSQEHVVSRKMESDKNTKLFRPAPPGNKSQP